VRRGRGERRGYLSTRRKIPPGKDSCPWLKSPSLGGGTVFLNTQESRKGGGGKYLFPEELGTREEPEKRLEKENRIIQGSHKSNKPEKKEIRLLIARERSQKDVLLNREGPTPHRGGRKGKGGEDLPHRKEKERRSQKNALN